MGANALYCQESIFLSTFYRRIEEKSGYSDFGDLNRFILATMGITSIFPTLDGLRNFLLITQFSLALGGLVFLKESSPYHSRVVFLWWSVSFSLGVFSLGVATYHFPNLVDTDYFDIATGSMIVAASVAYFLGCYEKPLEDDEIQSQVGLVEAVPLQKDEEVV